MAILVGSRGLLRRRGGRSTYMHYNRKARGSGNWRRVKSRRQARYIWGRK